MTNQPPIGANDYQAFFEASTVAAVVRINGSSLYNVDDVEINLNAHGATSDAAVVLPIKTNPDFSQVFANLGSTAATAEIFLGWPANPTPGAPPSIAGLTRAYYGLIAQYDADFELNEATFELRSLASPLVDEKIQMIATNATTIDFLQSVCEQFGLNMQAGTPNAPLTVQEVLGEMYVGGYDFAAAIHGMRIWDLILQCAQFDNVDVWEDQGTIYYVAPTLIQRPTVPIMYGRDLALGSGLKCQHALQFSRDIQVEVRSAQPRVSQSSATRYVTNDDGSVSVTTVNSQTSGSPQWGTPDIVTQRISPSGTVVTQRSVSGGNFSTTTSLGTEAPKLRYIYFLKNASPATCNAFAISQWRKISQHEYIALMQFPMSKAKGIIPLTALLPLSNCPYAQFNQTYYPRKLTLAGGKGKAFIYSVDGINHELPQGAV